MKIAEGYYWGRLYEYPNDWQIVQIIHQSGVPYGWVVGCELEVEMEEIEKLHGPIYRPVLTPWMAFDPNDRKGNRA